MVKMLGWGVSALPLHLLDSLCARVRVVIDGVLWDNLLGNLDQVRVQYQLFIRIQQRLP
jgi:hypothetical protein